MTPAAHRDYLAAFERIHTALRATQADRGTNQHLVTTHNGEELAWIVAERETVWRAVNEERTRLGHSPVRLADLERAETMATGHNDYTKKFALYATDIAFNRPPR